MGACRCLGRCDIPTVVMLSISQHVTSMRSPPIAAMGESFDVAKEAKERGRKATAVERVAKQFGSFTAFAEAIGVTRSTISHWNRPLGVKNGRGGSIPDRYHARILKEAKKRNLPVKPADLINV